MTVYVELIRNTPFLIQLYVIFFGLPAYGFKVSAIEAGLAPNDVVVVDGTEKLRDGTKVEIRQPGQPPVQKPATESPDGQAPQGPRT